MQTDAWDRLPARDLLVPAAQAPTALAERSRIQFTTITAQWRPKVDPTQVEKRANMSAEVGEVGITAAKAPQAAESAEDGVHGLSDDEPARFDRQRPPDVDPIMGPQRRVDELDAEDRARCTDDRIRRDALQSEREERPAKPGDEVHRDEPAATHLVLDPRPEDRKSTRLNSSHRCISYAVFCLK